MQFFIQNVIDALSVGSLYAILALAIALLFGVMDLVNFAHGELLMIGGYILVFVSPQSWFVLVAVTVAVSALVALGMERVAFRPLRGASPETLFIASFAVSYLLQNLAIATLSSRPKTAAMPAGITEAIELGGIRISKLTIVIVITTALCLFVLALFLKRTALGVQMRAASEDFAMARLLGVRANRVIAAAFALSGILAAVATLFLVTQSATVDPKFGVVPVIIGFVATALGGMGSLLAATLGAYVLGIVTVALQAYLPTDLRVFRDAFLYAAVVAILTVRPEGLLVSRARRTRV